MRPSENHLHLNIASVVIMLQWRHHLHSPRQHPSHPTCAPSRSRLLPPNDVVNCRRNPTEIEVRVVVRGCDEVACACVFCRTGVTKNHHSGRPWWLSLMTLHFRPSAACYHSYRCHQRPRKVFVCVCVLLCILGVCVLQLFCVKWVGGVI